MSAVFLLAIVPTTSPIPVTKKSKFEGHMSRRLEGDDDEQRQRMVSTQLSDAVKFIRRTTRDVAATKLRDAIYSKFNYPNHYDIPFLCSLGDKLGANLSRVTAKKRLNHKDILNELIDEIILKN